MRNNAYLKIILTVIAVEMMVLIFKTNTTEKIYFSETVANPKSIQAGYNISNVSTEPEQTIMNVNIVGIGGKSIPVKYNGWLPVAVANPVNTSNEKIPLITKPGK